MKRGFTLVELLGVFSIMSAVLLLSVPAVTNMLTKTTENQYEAYLNDIYLAAEAYISNCRNSYYELKDADKQSIVVVDTLLWANYLKSTMLNPLTKQKIKEESNNVIIVSMDSKTKKAYTYKYINMNNASNAEKNIINTYINDYIGGDNCPKALSTSEIETFETEINTLNDESVIKIPLLNKISGVKNENN